MKKKSIVTRWLAMMMIMALVVLSVPVKAQAATWRDRSGWSSRWGSGWGSGWWSPDDDQDNSENQTVSRNPIVFVHGMYSTGSVFLTLERYLQSQGYSSNEMIAVDLPDKVSYGAANSAVISNAVNKLLASTGASKVDIICHSMGGASSLYYIKNGGGAGKVDRLITLGGANRLVAQTAPSGVRVTTISSTSDTIVNPSLSRLTGANNVTISGVSHVGLLRSTTVQSEVMKALNQ